MRALIDLLVPSRCDGCGALAPPPWCEDCDHTLRGGASPAERCPRCADVDSPGHPCWAGPPPVTRLVTLGPWTGGVARAVTHAKLAGRAEVLAAAGRRLGDAVARCDLLVEAVVAVPTDRRRARMRGRDHTAVLAAAIGGRIDAQVVRPFAPVRGRPDGVGPGGRRTDSDGSWLRVVRPAGVRARRVLVVDDVVTTGATVAAVAGALSAAGASSVAAAVIGRAGGHALRPRSDPQDGRAQ